MEALGGRVLGRFIVRHGCWIIIEFIIIFWLLFIGIIACRHQYFLLQ